MRIRRNPGSPSVAVALSAMSPSRLRVKPRCTAPYPDQRRAIGMRRPCRPASSTLLCLDGQAAACRQRPAKGAGVWLPK
jgi:hypothetical protein